MTELEDEEGRLMESWPDDTEEGIVASAFRAMLPKSAVQVFSDGEFLMRWGEPCGGVYKLEEGAVEMEYCEEPSADTEDDEVSEWSASPCLIQYIIRQRHSKHSIGLRRQRAQSA